MINFKKYKNILITSYKNPDIDSVACMLAYEQLLKKQGINCQAVGFGKLQMEPEYILKTYKIKPPKMNLKNTDNFDAIIFLDSNKKTDFEELKLDPAKVIQIIDHHADPDINYFLHSEIITEPLGSLATKFVEMYCKSKIVIDKNTAVLFYAAILFNTFDLKYDNTCERDIKAANVLKKIVKISKKDFYFAMYKVKSDMTGRKLEEAIDRDYKKREIAGRKFLIGQLEILGTGDIIKNRSQEIWKILAKHKIKYGYDETFLCLSDPETNKTAIVAFDKEIKVILEKIFSKKFNGDCLIFDQLIARKIIIAKLRNYLEKK